MAKVIKLQNDWTNIGMSDKRRYGNALVVGVIEKIENEIEKIIDKEK